MTLLSRVSAFALLVLAVLLAIVPARADVFSLGEYSFQPGEEPGTYELVASLPDALVTGRAVTWPTGCTQIDASRQVQAGRARLSYAIRCDRELGRDYTIVTPWAVDGASYAAAMGGTTQLQAGDGGVVLPVGVTAGAARAFTVVARDFLGQGFLHILGGWDHLAFVMCLCLLTRGRTLLLLVTVFTIGHSLSLALAFFDVIHVPVPPVEAVIALSIAFMAREALLSDGRDDDAMRRRYIIVVGAFGLLHGLGFATALGEVGVPDDERLPGLVFFNIGVELGQLAFVAGMMGLVALARAVGQGAAFRQVALYGAGIIGCFWLIERTSSFA